MKILRARPLSDAVTARGAAVVPGTVLGLHAGALQVACGTGCLAIETLQRAGRNPVSAREFAQAVALDGATLQ